MTFIDFARAHGVFISPDRLMPGERIRRCGTVDKPKSTNGAYFWDGLKGWVFNWAADAKVYWFNDPTAKPWTDSEKAAWAAKRRSAELQQINRQREAARHAADLMRECQPAEHNYLAIKGFPKVLGMVAPDGALFVPMRNLQTNELQGAQLIRWVDADRVYEKKMLPGMKAKGAVFRIGHKTSQETFLCEGYCTGMSIEAALRSIGSAASVLVCFSAGNLEHVAPMVGGRVFVFADNDKSGTGEAAAVATGRPYCMADEVGMDANDLHQKRGLMAVAKKIMEVRMRC